MPQFVFRPMIVDRNADVVLLDELLDARQSLRSRVARDNHADTSPLAVFELRPDVGIFVFREIDGSGGMKLDARRGIVSQRGSLFPRIHREMVFDVLRVQGDTLSCFMKAINWARVKLRNV